MTSLPPPSSTSTSTKLPPSLSQYNFDPFAVHPFTSYASSNPNANAPTANHNHGNPLYAYPYSQPLGDYPTPHTPIPSPIGAIPIAHSPSPSKSKPYAYMPPRPTGIFVPFRKETSSPELSDVLKPQSSNTSVTTSKPRSNKTAPFIPTPSIGFSNS
ncbi:hypothetical protein BYT27DRAFT_7262092 [Phlegmacium glaucopus]|nr:hypothetical protein BYT27DRAFT_7262092 [Phlegmacium glaucopus]